METPQRSELEKKTEPPAWEVHQCALPVATMKWVRQELTWAQKPTHSWTVMVVQLRMILFISPHWCLCTCSPDGRQRDSLEPPLVHLHHPPPPPQFCLTKAAAISWQFVQLKVALTCSTAEQSGWVCDSTFLGVFRASLLWCVWTGALLIEFDFMFFNRFKFKLWLQNRCRCNCTNRFSFLLLFSNSSVILSSEPQSSSVYTGAFRFFWHI